jgi:hypothetical protein
LSSSDPPFVPPDLSDLPDRPSWREWPAKRPFYRVIPSGGDPCWFNPNTGIDPADPDRGGRFHPFLSMDTGDPVPTFYGGATLKVSLRESVFHDVAAAPAAARYVVSEGQLAQYAYFRSSFKRKLRLVDLAGAGAERLHMNPEHLTYSWPSHYPLTRACARLMHAKYGDADGMTWVSRRYAPHRAFVLFGDRVTAGEVRKPADVSPLTEPRTAGWRAVMLLIREADWILGP